MRTRFSLIALLVLALSVSALGNRGSGCSRL